MLTFTNIIRIATPRLYALCILSNVLSREYFNMIYQAIIRNVLQYCSSVFVGLNVKNCILCLNIFKDELILLYAKTIVNVNILQSNIAELSLLVIYCTISLT